MNLLSFLYQKVSSLRFECTSWNFAYCFQNLQKLAWRNCRSLWLVIQLITACFNQKCHAVVLGSTVTSVNLVACCISIVFCKIVFDLRRVGSFISTLFCCLRSVHHITGRREKSSKFQFVIDGQNFFRGTHIL